MTSLDYLDILSCVSKISGRTRCLADYICEMALLHTELSHYSSSEIAASCVLLSRLATAEGTLTRPCFTCVALFIVLVCTGILKHGVWLRDK